VWHPEARRFSHSSNVRNNFANALIRFVRDRNRDTFLVRDARNIRQSNSDLRDDSTIATTRSRHSDKKTAGIELGVELLMVYRVAQDTQFPSDDEQSRLRARPDVNQSNIDRITAELGRHAGDVGEKKRLKALMQKRLSDIALEGSKTCSKKAKPKNP